MAERAGWRRGLSDRDEALVGECLAALAELPFCDEREFQILVGLSRDEVRAVAREWPGSADPGVTYIAVNAAFRELAELHGPNQWPATLAATPAEVEDLSWRIHEASGHNDRTRAWLRETFDEFLARPDAGLHGLSRERMSLRDVAEPAPRYGVEVPGRLRDFLAAWPLGERVRRWSGAEPVAPVTLPGRYATLVPLAADHAEALYDASDDSVWHYLSYGPWRDAAHYRAWVEDAAASTDPVFFTVLVDGQPRGVVSYLRIEPDHGVVEIGHIWYAPSIQRTPATTEVTYLLAKHVFDDLGYRRLEWKCHALNARSRAAAERFGFTYEGTFRQHLVVKGRNRDTAWFALLDGEWPAVRAAFERWLDPANFDAAGRQRTPLRTG